MLLKKVFVRCLHKFRRWLSYTAIISSLCVPFVSLADYGPHRLEALHELRGAEAGLFRSQGFQRFVGMMRESVMERLTPSNTVSTALALSRQHQIREFLGMPEPDAFSQALLRVSVPHVRLSSGMSVGALAQITFDPDAGRPIIHGTPAEGLRLPQLTGFPIPEQQRPTALITPLPDQERPQVESFPAHDPLGGMTIHTITRDESLIARVAAFQMRHEQGAASASAAGTSTEGEVEQPSGLIEALDLAIEKPHGNSKEYLGETHVYVIRDADGKIHKIGESMQGLDLAGLSKRGQTQARRLERHTGKFHKSEVRETFESKAEARDYETELITRLRRRFGEDKLPGNKGNR